MNVAVTLNGNDISNYVVSYTREQQICTGIGMMDLSLSGDFPTEIHPWDTLVLYEEGSQVAVYHVSSVSIGAPTYLIDVEAQDGSKYLVDYFISDNYETGDDAYTTKYWLEKFLTEAGVSYEFQSGLSLPLMSNNSALGMVSAYEQVVQLLQMSGWYMYFDSYDICKIGKIESDLASPAAYFDETDLLSIKTSRSDKILRNKAVVWGAADPSGKEWVFANVTRKTPWDYSDSDSRTAVVSNSNIPTVSAAYSIAYKMLDEWGDLLFIKDAMLTGGRGLSLADVVGIDSGIYTGTGVITTVGSEMSEQGFKTHIILDEKCPRIFGMWNMGACVYAGTWGEGVKRKPLKGNTWSTYNSGLPEMNVKDLFVNDGILSCVTENGRLFVSKEWLGYWTEIPLSGVEFDGIVGSGIVKARAVTQDKTTNNVKVLVDTGPDSNYYNDYERTIYSGGECAVIEFTPNKRYVGCYPLTLPSGEYTFSGYTTDGPGFTIAPATESGRGIVGIDIENDYEYDFISIMISGVVRETRNYGCEETGGMWHTGRDRRTIVHFSRDVDYDIDRYVADDGRLLSIYNNESVEEAIVFGVDKSDISGKQYYYVYDIYSKTKIWEIEREPDTTEGELCVKRVQSSVDDSGDTYYIYFAPNTSTQSIRADKWIVGSSEITTTVIPEPSVPDELLPAFYGATTIWAGTDSPVYNNEGSVSVTGRPYYLRLFWVGNNKYAGAVYTMDEDSLILDDVIWERDILEMGCYRTGDPPYDFIPGTIETRNGAGGSRQATILSRGNSYAVYATFVEHVYSTYYIKQVWPGLYDEWYYRLTTTHFIVANKDVADPIIYEGTDPPIWYSEIVQAESTTELYDYVLVKFEMTGIGESYQYSNGYDRNLLTPPFWTAYPYSYTFYSLRNSDSVGIVREQRDIMGTDIHWYWIDAESLSYTSELVDVEGPGLEGDVNFDLIRPFPATDTDTGDVYWAVSGVGEIRNSLVGIDKSSSAVVINLGTLPGDTSTYENLFNCGKVFCYSYSDEGDNIIDYISGWVYNTSAWGSLALRRDTPEAYTVLNAGRLPQRLDISSSYPLVLSQDKITTLELGDNAILGGPEIMHPQYRVVGTGYIGDFRYCYTASGITSSGTDTYNNTLFITVSGILLTANIDFIDEDRTIEDFTPLFVGYVASGVSTSGMLEHVETSNYLSEEQCIFVCTSGTGPRFYQKDKLPFREQSTDLGEYPVTIIRLDDRF